MPVDQFGPVAAEYVVTEQKERGLTGLGDLLGISVDDGSVAEEVAPAASDEGGLKRARDKSEAD